MCQTVPDERTGVYQNRFEIS